VRTLLTLAQYKLLITSMKRPGTGLSFEIRITIHEIINAILPGEASLDLHSEIQFFTDITFYDQLQRRMLISRY